MEGIFSRISFQGSKLLLCLRHPTQSGRNSTKVDVFGILNSNRAIPFYIHYRAKEGETSQSLEITGNHLSHH